MRSNGDTVIRATATRLIFEDRSVGPRGEAAPASRQETGGGKPLGVRFDEGGPRRLFVGPAASDQIGIGIDRNSATGTPVPAWSVPSRAQQNSLPVPGTSRGPRLSSKERAIGGSVPAWRPQLTCPYWASTPSSTRSLQLQPGRNSPNGKPACLGRKEPAVEATAAW